MLNTMLLNELVEKSGLSLTRLGKEMGLTHSTLSLLIRGVSQNPHPDTINSIANYFGISSAELLMDTFHNNEFIQENKVNLKSLNEVLQYLMIRSGIINSSHLHQHTGIAIQTIDRILSKDTESPNSNTLSKLAEFFNISIAQLKGLEEIPKGNIFTVTKSKTLVPLIKIEHVLMWMNKNEQTYVIKYITSELVTLPTNSFAIEQVVSPKLKVTYIINPEIIPEIGDTFLIKNSVGNIEFVEEINGTSVITQGTSNKTSCNIIGVVVEELRYRI
ncbi:MAG: helix-turn-helix domain-containing protein [Burkholderiales bacterium]|nr:helix-turn-helix domain-containing protein [Burkholderiales bacterium]